MQRPRVQPMAALDELKFSKWRSGTRLARFDRREAYRTGGLEWNGCPLFADAVHLGVFGFRGLHPRSLLERR